MTVDQELINAAKTAKGITNTDEYDTLVEMHLQSALIDMGIAGVEVPEYPDAFIRTTAIIYFLLNFHFGNIFDAKTQEVLQKDYDHRKGQLTHATGYTDWLGVDG